MKLEVYTGLTTRKSIDNQKKLKKILKERNVELEETSIGETSIFRKHLVPSIRESGFTGTFEELSELPIMKCGKKTYPAKVINDEKKLMKILKENDRVEVKKIHKDPIFMINENTEKKIDETMEEITKNTGNPSLKIEDLVEKMTENEKYAFLVGFRIAKHSDANIIDIYFKGSVAVEPLLDEIDKYRRK
jgi:arsenate reductase-like glutaredoxin family protein